MNAKSAKNALLHTLTILGILVMVSCNLGTPKPTDVSSSVPEVGVAIELDSQPAILETQTPVPSPGELSIKYRVDFYCLGTDMLARLVITPLGGKAPFEIPGYGFIGVDNINFLGYLGEIYILTLVSSDQPPLIWKGSIELTPNALLPVCESNEDSTSPPEQNNGNGDGSTSSYSSSFTSSSSSSGSTSSSSSSGSTSSSSSSSSKSTKSTSSSSCREKDGKCREEIPECPPDVQSDKDPPGICKIKP